MLLAGYIVPHPPILIPEIGLGEEKKAAATSQAMHEIGKEIARLKPETIVIISPHGPLFTDAISIRVAEPLEGDLGNFGAPAIVLTKHTDQVLIDKILKRAYDADIPSVKFDADLANRFDLDESADHGVIVPLSFVEPYYQDYKIVAINYGLLAPEALYEFGQCIREASEGKNIVVIASGDLSHHLKDSGTYAYHEEGCIFDRALVDALTKKEYLSIFNIEDKLVARAGECGLRSIYILLGALDRIGHEVRWMSYEGPFGVGYAIFKFECGVERTLSLLDEIKALIKDKTERERQREDIYLKLARDAVELYIKKGDRLKLPSYAQVDDLLKGSRGVFVSIKDRGGLRGCMGSTVGLEINLGNEIIATAIKAATQDPRFDPIEMSELKSLKISVDILSAAEKVTDKTQLDPKLYGIIVSSDYKKGLLLPDLEGVQTVEEQIRIALNKAGIKSTEGYDIERFTVERHEV